LVEEVFSEEDVGKICEIILCSRSQPDKLVWAGNKIGEFTVRSAYHLVQEEKQMDAGSSSNPQSFSMFWKRIWRRRKINQENQEKNPKTQETKMKFTRPQKHDHCFSTKPIRKTNPQERVNFFFFLKKLRKRKCTLISLWRSLKT
jgi:hypothetical protein